MTAPKPPLAERFERRLNAFFVAPTDGTSAAVFRILLGALALWQAVGIWWNLHRFWGESGMIPWRIVGEGRWHFLFPFYWAPESRAVLQGQALAFTVAAIFLLVGFRPRLFTLVLAYVHASFQIRNPFILNSGDRLFMIIAALAALAPLGHKYSVDAWLRARRGQAAPAAMIWGQRIIGLQIAYVYLNSAFAKLANKRWQNGMALRDVLASPVFAEWPTYVDFRPLVWGMTYSTLLLELSFPLGVWLKRYRPYLIAWGVAFHVGIDLLMVIPIFSAIMIASYPVYLTDDETKWVLARLRRPSLLFERRKPEAAGEVGPLAE